MATHLRIDTIKSAGGQQGKTSTENKLAPKGIQPTSQHMLTRYFTTIISKVENAHAENSVLFGTGGSKPARCRPCAIYNGHVTTNLRQLFSDVARPSSHLLRVDERLVQSKIRIR